MTPARIAELLRPFLSDDPKKEAAVLPPFLTKQISTYIDILLRWNARINLTAIRDPEEIVTRHFGESLFAARRLFPDAPNDLRNDDVRNSDVRNRKADLRGSTSERISAIRAADLGSGAGFPGLPIKLWAPQISMTLIESNHKKAAFLRELVRSLRLTDVNIESVRAETLSQTYDVVTLRAVERFPDILPVAARLLSPGGQLLLLTSRRHREPSHSILPEISWKPAILVPDSQSRILEIGVREPQL